MKGEGPHSEKEMLKPFMNLKGDDNKKSELTGSQLKLLYRLVYLKQNGYDISETLGKIREESLQVQRETHKS